MPDSSEIWKFVLYKSSGSLTSRQAEPTLRNLYEKYLQGRYRNRITAETARGRGINGFAFKPIVKSEFAKIVREVLDKAKESIQQ